MLNCSIVDHLPHWLWILISWNCKMLFMTFPFSWLLCKGQRRKMWKIKTEDKTQHKLWARCELLRVGMQQTLPQKKVVCVLPWVCATLPQKMSSSLVSVERFSHLWAKSYFRGNFIEWNAFGKWIETQGSSTHLFFRIHQQYNIINAWTLQCIHCKMWPKYKKMGWLFIYFCIYSSMHLQEHLSQPGERHRLAFIKDWSLPYLVSLKQSDTYVQLYSKQSARPQ